MVIVLTEGLPFRLNDEIPVNWPMTHITHTRTGERGRKRERERDARTHARIHRQIHKHTYIHTKMHKMMWRSLNVWWYIHYKAQDMK